jgi:hypothetical protein
MTALHRLQHVAFAGVIHFCTSRDDPCAPADYSGASNDCYQLDLLQRRLCPENILRMRVKALQLRQTSLSWRQTSPVTAVELSTFC